MKSTTWLASCAVCLLAVPGLAAAQAAQPEPAFSTTGAFVALSVPNLGASSRWYQEKLGLRVVLQLPPYQGITARILEGGGLIVELIHNPAASPASTSGPVQGITKAGIIVNDYDKTLATLRARGVTIAMGPFPPRDGQRANFVVRDESGNLLQFFGR